MPLVSVLMTAYNREKYIELAIKSVLASSYENFELIIVDDCSSDNTVGIAREYEQKDPRVRVYVNEENLGDYHNRNRAASYAKGKYIKYVDSDDLIYPHGLSVMVNSMEQFPEAALGIMSTSNQEDRPYPYQMDSKEAYLVNFYSKGIFDTGPTGLIFHTEKFREVGGFSGKRYIGDFEINLKLAAKWPVVMLNSSLVYWRNHSDQEYVIGTKGTGYLELSLPMLETELFRDGCPLSKNQAKDIIGYYRKISARKILKLALGNRQFFKSFELSRNLSLRPGDYIMAVIAPDKKYKLQ